MKSISKLKSMSIWSAVPILFYATSCLPDPLEVSSVPPVEEQVVVSSQMLPDQTLIIMLTKTFGALEASDNSDPLELLEQIAINDATVTVKGPAGTDTLTFFGNGLYADSTISFEEGAGYQLFVNSAIGVVYAETQVKRKVEFDAIEADLYYNGFNDTLAQITYSLVDHPEENFYMINVQEVEREDFVENLLNPRAFTVLMDDREFNGQTFEERFRVFPRDYHPGDTIAVTLSNISEDYFRFMQLRLDNRFSFIEFVSEPVNYPSNVIGGRGFFNLYLPDVKVFVFD